MNKRFIHFKTKAAFNAAVLGTDYDNNSIIFIKDSQEIWTHGLFYAIPDSYKTKITNLETAVNTLNAIYAFKKVSDGTNTFVASSGKETLNLKAGANTSVTVDATTGDVTIGSTLTSNSYYPNASGEALAENAIQTLTGSDAVSVTGSGTSRAIALTLNNEGKNVTLSLTALGLSAEVTNVDSLVPVDGVASGDKVLTLTNKKISATISLSIDDTAGEDGKKYIRLTGANNADLGKIDIADFVKDGMLDAASFDQTNHNLTLTFNTSAGKEAVNVDLSSLVDVYDGSTVKLKAVAIPTTAEEPAASDSVDSAVANLIAKDREIVKSVNDLNTVSLKSIKKGTDGTYVTTTIGAKTNNEQSVAVAVTTKDIASATTTDNGLAVAADVKSYVDDLFSWEERN